MTDVLPAPPQAETTFVPANRLVQSEKNARRTDKAKNIDDLAASILAVGLLHNLVVTPDGDNFAVDAGERRRLAVALLVSRGNIPEDWPVHVRIIDESVRTAASATENVEREQMHPADLFDACRQLTVEGWTIDRIADVFSVTPLVVERYLGIAAAAPALLDLFRTGEITTEQLIALCATDDHALQESIWHNTPSYDRLPGTLRRAALAAEIDASNDSRVAFIGGLAAFVAAGGEVRRDLFSGDGQGGFISDVPLLNRLVAETLEAAANEVRAEGWGWVDVWTTFDWTEFNRLGHIAPIPRELDAEAAARVAALQDEHATLEGEANALADLLADEDEFPEAEAERHDAMHARLEEIEAEIAGIEEARIGYDPQAMATAGAVVSIDRGKLRIERGLVRTADRAKAAEAVGTPRAVTGGRETGVAGRKGGDLSDALTRSLLGYRNLAAQSMTAANPHVAKVLLACWAVQSIRRTISTSVPTDLRIAEMGSGTRTQHPITDDEGEGKRKAFEKVGLDLIASLPPAEDELWDALMGLKPAKLDRLIAYAVASSVSLNRNHTGLTAGLLSALGFNMADHFVPTAANYFGRVSKSLIVDALSEARIVDNPAALLALKKDALAARAARSLAKSRWVPSLIRTPGTVPVAAAETAPAPPPVLLITTGETAPESDAAAPENPAPDAHAAATPDAAEPESGGTAAAGASAGAAEGAQRADTAPAIESQTSAAEVAPGTGADVSASDVPAGARRTRRPRQAKPEPKAKEAQKAKGAPKAKEKPKAKKKPKQKATANAGAKTKRKVKGTADVEPPRRNPGRRPKADTTTVTALRPAEPPEHLAAAPEQLAA